MAVTPANGFAKANGAVWSKPIGRGVLRLWRLGLDMDLAAGVGVKNQRVLNTILSSTDPRPNSMTLQAADFSISASYDPYFDAFFVLVFSLDLEGSSSVKVEEAFLRSKWFLRKSFRVKAGQFLTRFGQFNPLHMHDWTFMTQPVIAARALGDGGTAGMGFELDVNLPLPWKSVLTLSVQDARGGAQQGFLSTEDSFLDRPVGGRGINHREVDGLDKLVYHLRLSNAFELGGRTELVIGGSALFGPNVTGTEARTIIAGADIALEHRWTRGGRLEIGAEYIHRLYDAAADPDRGFAAGRLEDYGLFAYAMVYPIRRYGLGLRYEYATGKGESVGAYASRATDPFRGDRQRISPLLVWRFARLARLKLQYNYDRAAFLGPKSEAHSIFVGVSWAFGLGDEHFGQDDHHDH